MYGERDHCTGVSENIILGRMPASATHTLPIDH